MTAGAQYSELSYDSDDELIRRAILDTAAIIERLTHYEQFPVAAIEAARAERAAVVPECLRIIDEYLARDTTTKAEYASLFLIFHLLGEWRETSAYRPLARLVRHPTIEGALGDAVTETLHQVMAGVFDGDPQPLYEIILDRKADEFVRNMTFKALSTLVFDGQLSISEVSRFLTLCSTELESDRRDLPWVGWVEAIATLGLKELRPLVECTFAAELIGPFWLSLEEFDEALAYALSHSPPDNYWGARLRPFGDAVAELSSFTDEHHDQSVLGEALAERIAALVHASRRRDGFSSAGSDATYFADPTSPFVDPSRGVGRNDPCPCGSGKKYKKCCLN